MSAAMYFSLGTKERVREIDSRGKRTIGVRATEVLLYLGNEKILYKNPILFDQTGVRIGTRSEYFKTVLHNILVHEFNRQISALDSMHPFL